MTMLRRWGLGLLLMSTLAPAAQAEASAVSSSGFTITHALVVDAEPDRAWTAFTQLPSWWNGAHSWSGQAANMSLDAQAGGCWCERWGNGQSAMHGQVLAVQTGSMLRLRAELGPLQQLPVVGVLTFGTARRDGATRLRITYRVGGPPDAELDKLAAAVDGVIGEQVRRLKAFIETGRPQ